MGFPIGEQDIVFVERTDVIKSLANNLTKAKHCYQVTPSDLCKAITANQAVDEEFKLNFIVLLINALREGSSTPYVNNNMVQFAGDIDNYNIYNCCRYLIQCLQEQFVVWNQNREKSFFKGSCVFGCEYCLYKIYSENSIKNRVSYVYVLFVQA